MLLIILRRLMVTIILDLSVTFRKLSSKVTYSEHKTLETSITFIFTAQVSLQES